MNSTWLRGSRAPRIAALIMAAVPTLLMWVAAQATGLTEEMSFGWFAYTPLSIDSLLAIMRVLDWTMLMIQLAVPALLALAALLFVRRWTSWGVGAVLLVGGLLLGGARLLLGSGPAAVTPGEFSPLYAALALAVCYIIAAALLFVSAARITPAAEAGMHGPTAEASPRTPASDGASALDVEAAPATPAEPADGDPEDGTPPARS